MIDEGALDVFRIEVFVIRALSRVRNMVKQRVSFFSGDELERALAQLAQERK